MKNKLGDERVLSIYLFVIYVIVAIGIASGVIIFYGAPLDVRGLEANVLSDRVIDCLADKGQIRQDFFKPEFNLMKICSFNFSDNNEKYQGEEQYAVKVRVYEFDSCKKNSKSGFLDCTKEINSLSIGRTDFLELCSATGDKIPVCNLKQAYLLHSPDNVILEVMSAVGKVSNVQKK